MVNLSKLIKKSSRKTRQENSAGKLGRKTWQENLAGKPGRKTWQENLAGKLGRKTWGGGKFISYFPISTEYVRV